MPRPLIKNASNMPAQSPIVVCKPRVPSFLRLVDPGLRCLTVRQLCRRAHDEGLDVSCLKERWEFVHVLSEHRIRSTQANVGDGIDTQGRTFFDLPGEVRNQIYSYVLVHEYPLIARYESTSLGRVFKLNSLPQSSLQLTNMSYANLELREEARSFFFYNNRFEVEGDVRSGFVDFLDGIGSDGCANITSLKLRGNFSDMDTLNSLRALIACTNLRDLTIQMPLKCIIHEQAFYEMWVSLKLEADHSAESAWQTEMRSKIGVFAHLPALRVLKIDLEILNWNSERTWHSLLSSFLAKLLTKYKVCNVMSRVLKDMFDGQNVDFTVSAFHKHI